MAAMIGRVALGGACAGLALYVAVQATDENIQAAAALTSSCFVGFTVTSIVLERQRERKHREASTDVYLELLRQMNTPRFPVTPPQPAVCRGCEHYHGRVYGSNFLVCGMHPYGVEDDRCPDWQGVKMEDKFDDDELVL